MDTEGVSPSTWCCLSIPPRGVHSLTMVTGKLPWDNTHGHFFLQYSSLCLLACLFRLNFFPQHFCCFWRQWLLWPSRMSLPWEWGPPFHSRYSWSFYKPRPPLWDVLPQELPDSQPEQLHPPRLCTKRRPGIRHSMKMLAAAWSSPCPL